MTVIDRLRRRPAETSTDQEVIDRLLLTLGRMESVRVRSESFDRVRDAEFTIFSQFGEDGIIQHLIGRVPIEEDVFVEFGVQDYRESNTRFLLCNDNWRGLILDGGTAHIDFIHSNPIGWRHAIDARSAFVTSENINELLTDAGCTGDIGLLSVDIDGNDFWVLDAITAVSPRILVVEYNSTFGPDHAVTVPYDSTFVRTSAHPSNLYWGASLPAICHAADRKGYALVAGNSAGNNAFFVRRDVIGDLSPRTPHDEWVDARFRESRGLDGELTYIMGRPARLALIADMPLVDVTTGKFIAARDCLDASTGQESH